MVDADGLGDLKEPDELEPVKAVGAGLVMMDLWQPRIHRGVGADEAVDVGEAEVSAHGVHHRHHRGVHQATVTKTADIQLNMSSLDPDQGVHPVGLTPGEPLPQLVGVQDVSAAGVAGQERDRC